MSTFQQHQEQLPEELHTQTTHGNAHYGSVLFVCPEALQTILKRTDNLGQWAPGVVDSCLVENGIPCEKVGCVRRTVLGAGIPVNRLQSQHIASDAIKDNTVHGSQTASQRAQEDRRFYQFHDKHISTKGCGLAAEEEEAGLFKDCLLRERLVETFFSPAKSYVKLEYLVPASPTEPSSPFRGIEMLKMTTTVSVSALSSDQYKSFLEFDVRYSFLTTCTSRPMRDVGANNAGAAEKENGEEEEAAEEEKSGYLPAATMATIMADQQKQHIDNFLNNHWLRPLALSLNEFALNATYPILGVDSPSSQVIRDGHQDQSHNLLAANAEFRIDLSRRAEYDHYESQVVQFHATKATVLDKEAVIAAYEQLLSSWTVLVVEEGRKDRAVAAARNELLAANHITSTAAGTLVASAERVTAEYHHSSPQRSRGEGTNTTTTSSSNSHNPKSGNAPSSPTGGHESAEKTVPVEAGEALPAEPAAATTTAGHNNNGGSGASGGAEKQQVKVPQPPPPRHQQAAAGAPSTPPTEPIDMATIRKAMCAGVVLSDAQMKSVFDSLDANGNGWLSTKELQELWSSFDDYGQYDETLGTNTYLGRVKERENKSLATPLKAQPVEPLSSTPPAAKAILGTSTAVGVGVSPTKKEEHFAKLVDGWVKKNLSYRTPRRGGGGSGGAADVKITFPEFCIFMLQIAKR